MQMGIWVRQIFFCQTFVCPPFMSTDETVSQVPVMKMLQVKWQAFLVHTMEWLLITHIKSSKVTDNMGKNNLDTLVIRTVFIYVSTMCIIQTLSPTAHSIRGHSLLMCTILKFKISAWVVGFLLIHKCFTTFLIH